MANILKRHGSAPAPERCKSLSWREFIRSHLAVLAVVDFFTVVEDRNANIIGTVPRAVRLTYYAREERL